MQLEEFTQSNAPAKGGDGFQKENNRLLDVPVALLGTLLFESGSTARFVTGPVSALVVSAGVIAGVLVHQRRWAALLGFTGLVASLAIGAGALALGVIGVLLGGIAFLVGLVTGGIPLLYGIVFGCSHPHGISGDS